MSDTHNIQPWYLCEDEAEAADQLEATVKMITEAQNDRLFNVLKDGSIYLNRDIANIGVSPADGYVSMPVQIFNVTQPIVDTQVSKQVEAETKCTFETEDGDFGAHQAAEDMDRFVWGEFERLNLHVKGEKALRDACWAGDGYLKWYSRNGKACVDRCFPLEIVIDDAQCMGTEPQEMYQVRYVSRNWARQFYPDLADEISELPNTFPPYAMPNTDGDVVRMVEGWHLASDEGEEDGRHILAIGHHSVVDEPWCYTTFPFSRISWSPALIGAYSDSLVAQLRPLQLEHGKLMKRIQHSLQLMSVPRIFQNAQTKLSPEFSNQVGQVIKYTGQKPEFDTSPSVNPELYQQVERLEEKMYKIARTNPMQSGDMPSRFDSRPALREAQEIADQPHAWFSRNWQRFIVDCGRQMVRVARQIVKEEGTYKAFGRARGFIEEIDWKECNLDDNRFVLKATPSSLLPTTPTGKRLVVQDLMQNQLITDPNDAWELLAGMPDVDAYKSEKTAQKRLVDKQIYLMVKKQTPMLPDEVQDPVYCKRRAQAQLQLLLTKNNVPDDVFDCLDNYIASCDQLYQQANPPPPPPQPGAVDAAASGANPNGGQPSPLPPGPGGISPDGSIPGQLGPIPAGPGAGPGAPAAA